METTNEPNLSLEYRDSDNLRRKLEDCNIRVDTAGRYWLWSEQLESNLAYKAKTREDCFLESINMLLFIISMRDERIQMLQKIADLANAFADQIKPDEES